MNKKNRVYIIAEAGVNHNGSLKMAKQLIDVAADAGADAVKFQTFKAEKVISKVAPKAQYQIATTGIAETQLEMVKKLELDAIAHNILIQHCKKRRIQFLSSPFDLDSVDLLANVFKIPCLKIASGEITNAVLLLKAAHTGKKIILSTGMSTLADVEDALGVLAFGYLGLSTNPSLSEFRKAYCSKPGQQALKKNVTLLHCTTEYPSAFMDVNLRVMDTMRNAFDLSIGLSDHTPGIAIPIAAVARGAEVIEKHFTLDRNLPGPDHKASLEKDELKLMVRSIREVGEALGSAIKIPAISEKKNARIARKSLVAAKDIEKGERFTKENLTIKRPGSGISPMRFWEVLGTLADRKYLKDEIIIG